MASSTKSRDLRQGQSKSLLHPQSSTDMFSGTHKKGSSSKSNKGKESSRGKGGSMTPPFPTDFGFMWSINPVEIIPSNLAPRYELIKGTNDAAKYWFPPFRKDNFRVLSPEIIYQWNLNAKAERFKGRREELKKFSVASVFVQSLQDNFVAVEEDCVEHDIKKRDRGWSQIKFNHLKDGRAGLSEIVFEGDHSTLAVPADGSTWMPQVIPAVYNRATRGPRRYSGQSYSNDGLCGKLSLIIAMAAFSAPEESAEEAVASSFQYPNWVQHQWGHGRYDERGMVIKIYVSKSSDTKPEHLRAFEDGYYGAIFEIMGSSGVETSSTSSQTAGSSAPSYTLSSAQYGTTSSIVATRRDYMYPPYTSTSAGQPGVALRVPDYAVPRIENQVYPENDDMDVDDDVEEDADEGYAF